ncbi:20570_t:CDS:2, partial [Gigaspora rosea]
MLITIIKHFKAGTLTTSWWCFTSALPLTNHEVTLVFQGALLNALPVLLRSKQSCQRFTLQ